MKVRVDRDLCEANAVCASIIPEVFEIDDDDHLHILVEEIPANLADSVRHAVRRCPRTALSAEG